MDEKDLTAGQPDALYAERESVLRSLGVLGEHFCVEQRVRWLSIVRLSDSFVTERLERLVRGSIDAGLPPRPNHE